MNGGLRHFQQLRFYCDEIETRNWEEVSFSSLIVPRELSVEEEPWTALHNATHVIETRPTCVCGSQVNSQNSQNYTKTVVILY